MPLTDNEESFLRHMMRYGSDGYPVSKVGRTWQWIDFRGCSGAPTVYKTKREAFKAVDNYIDVLLDKKAGRI